MLCKPPDLNRAVPWVAAIVGVSDKAQLSPNNSPTQSSYPNAQYENPARFGVHGNLPTASYTNVRDVSDYTVTPPLSPQPRHSQCIFELREFLRALQCGAECAPLHRLRTSRVHPNADRPAHVPYARNTSPSRRCTTQRTDLRHAARLALVPHPWGTISLRRRTS